ncbi:MAG: LPS export ABC transporter periplasmic protein LptC [Methylacidiphilales bacterium]|nr:LPS export ABC transporter periplasmic protein LptC [Candidatus Methylacidiphilales bacterium]
MRLLALSIGTSLLVFGAAWAQTQGSSGGSPQLPVGQSFKNFEFPIYEDSILKATLTAAQATGITLNRADTSDLKIELYDNGAVTTTITSPRADLYVTDRKMRTKNTVHIVRSDSDTTAQVCDFDLNAKKYLLRTNVRVVLKNFDINPSATANQNSAMPRSSGASSLLDSPGSAAPVAPPLPDNK